MVKDNCSSSLLNFNSVSRVACCSSSPSSSPTAQFLRDSFSDFVCLQADNDRLNSRFRSSTYSHHGLSSPGASVLQRCSKTENCPRETGCPASATPAVRPISVATMAAMISGRFIRMPSLQRDEVPRLCVIRKMGSWMGEHEIGGRLDENSRLQGRSIACEASKSKKKDRGSPNRTASEQIPRPKRRGGGFF